MSNEITVKLNTRVQEFCKILEDKKFSIFKKYILDDTYFVPNSLELEGMTCREKLKKAILIRVITDSNTKEKVIKFTIKDKQITAEGQILSQSKIDCEILNAEDGRKFLEKLGYYEILHIKENDIVYKKDNLEIAIKDIENGDNLLEIETTEGDFELDTIDKIIKKLDSLDLPVDTSNYFVKKAEIELNKKFDI